MTFKNICSLNLIVVIINIIWSNTTNAFCPLFMPLPEYFSMVPLPIRIQYTPKDKVLENYLHNCCFQVLWVYKWGNTTYLGIKNCLAELIHNGMTCLYISLSLPLSLSLSNRTLCPLSILIIGWWCSIL